MPLSITGWTMTALTVPVIILQLLSFSDPSTFMHDYHVTSEPIARLIAFLLILINIYDLMGALQENWSVYYFSLLSRALAAPMFYTFGPEWHGLAGVEAATLVLLGGAMAMGRRGGSGKRK